MGARQAVSVTAAEYTSKPINAPAVWQMDYTGTNIGVAVIDSRPCCAASQALPANPRRSSTEYGSSLRARREISNLRGPHGRR
jgi:hypothetical protein